MKRKRSHVKKEDKPKSKPARSRRIYRKRYRIRNPKPDRKYSSIRRKRSKQKDQKTRRYNKRTKKLRSKSRKTKKITRKKVQQAKQKIRKVRTKIQKATRKKKTKVTLQKRKKKASKRPRKISKGRIRRIKKPTPKRKPTRRVKRKKPKRKPTPEEYEKEIRSLEEKLIAQAYENADRLIKEARNRGTFEQDYMMIAQATGLTPREIYTLAMSPEKFGYDA